MSFSTAPEDKTHTPALAQPAATRSLWSRIGAALQTEPWLLRLVLILLFGLYVRTVAFSTVYDDNVPGSWSPRLRDIGQFFAHDIFGSDGTAHSVYYRPLPLCWGFLLSYFTGGAPGWMHLFAVLVHLGVVLLAFEFGRRLLHDNRLALFSALLFGLHPTKVESVAWIGGSLVDGLCAVFFFASLIAFLDWFASESKIKLAFSVLLFAFAVFTKETMLVIPALMAVYLWLESPRGGRFSRMLVALPWYGVVGAVYMAIRHRIIKPPAATAVYVYHTYTHANLWTAPYAIWWYVRHLVAPWRLSVEYEVTILRQPTLRNFVLPGIGALLLMGVIFWLWYKWKSKTVAFLIIWFVLTLAPAVVLSVMVSEHDRYLYLPSYAFCVFVAWGILKWGSLGNRTRLALILGIVALWSGLTWHETGYWDCEKTLWTRVNEIAPQQAKAQLQLAFMYDNEKNVPKAIELLDQAIQYHPASPKLWAVRSAVLVTDKQYDQARPGLLKVLELTDPNTGPLLPGGESFNYRKEAAYNLARVEFETKHVDDAERYLTMALSFDPTGPGYHALLSRIRSAQGRQEEAKAEAALELRLRIEQQRKNIANSHP